MEKLSVLILYRYALIGVGSGAVLLVGRGFRLPTRRILVASGAAALLMFASVSFLLTALISGEVSALIPISSMSFLFTAVLSFLVFRERLHWGKVAGLAAAVASIVVIA